MAAPGMGPRVLLALVTALVVAAYGKAVGADGAALLRAATTPAPTTSADSATAEPRLSAMPVATPRPAPATAVPSRAIAVGETDVFARVSGVALVHPAERVERVGFHQASDVHSLNMTPAGNAVRPKTLPTRHRPTPRHSAVDVVVHPLSAIRAPVTGVVKRAGNYSLYCKTPDAFAVISPDGHPGVEVKMLHISGLRVRPGDRVVAGSTLIAERPTKLPFGSQVDAFTARPAWPHVHMEVTRLDIPSATPVPGPSTLAFSQHCG